LYVIENKTLLDVMDQVWARRLEREAYMQVRMGLPVTQIAHGSLNNAEDEAAFARAQLEAMSRIDSAALTHADWLNYASLRWTLERAAESVDLWWGTFPVTPYMAYWLNMFGQMIFRAFSFEGASDADRYLTLMQDYGAAVGSLENRLKQQAARGWRVPRPAIPGAINTLRAIRGALAYFFLPSAERLSAIGDSAAFIERAAAVLNSEIQPRFDAILAYLDDDYTAKAPEAVGIGQYPGGEAVYRQLMRANVTFDIDIETIHQTGLDEVTRLTDAMRQVRESVNFHGDEDAFRAHLARIGRLHATSAEQVEGRYRNLLGRLEPHIPRYFAKQPNAPYGVKRLDPELEAGMSYGYYEAPTPTQPIGLYRYNGSGLDTRSQINTAALIFHELIPGHHFHLARQAENTDLHPLRREEMSLTGYNEGWAEYAADLPREMGLYDDPIDLYGLLVHQRFVSQRLVIDTGMNILGWTLQQGRDFMRANTMESETQVGTETLRYSTDLPGQALGYRLGFLKMSEFRSRAQQKLGSHFDIRAFHETILAHGAMPLEVLAQHVDYDVAQAAQNGNAN
jgi:uncharacterized protein (DUF885 family)